MEFELVFEGSFEAIDLGYVVRGCFRRLLLLLLLLLLVRLLAILLLLSEERNGHCDEFSGMRIWKLTDM